MPDPMQKESAQSDHPIGRKRPKRAQLLVYFSVCPNQKNWTTFWTFSLDWTDRIELIPFASFHATPDTYNRQTTYNSENFEIPFFLRLTPFVGPLRIFVGEKNTVSRYSLIYWSPH
jgi:hypothetical protein